MATISVVIPVYNGERTIAESVNSVLEQTFQDFELIVIDDGSHDATTEILAAIDDPRLKVFSYPNAGVAVSRNRGVELASGEFVSFLDADDLWTRDKLEMQLNALRDHPEAAVSYSWTDFIDETGNRTDFGIYPTLNGYVFPDLLELFFLGNGSNALVRSSVFNQIEGFDQTVTPAEDWDLFLRLAANFDFVAVPKAHILYRVVSSSLSSNVLLQEKQMLKVLERAYFQEPGKSLLHLRKTSYANMYLYLAGRVLRETPSRQNGKLAARFLWLSVLNDPRILRQIPTFLILIFKIATALVLSPKNSLAIRASVKSLLQRSSKTALDDRNR
jgi:glycosyltransferase involved in cell wall biosynthesis